MQSRRFNWADRLFIALLAAVTAAVYAGVLSNGFIRFDDPRYISENPHVLAGLTREGVIWAFTTFFKSNWQPITWLSHMLDVELFGTDPAGHHAMSALLHVANSLLLFAVLRAATRASGPSAVVAALFALHPTHVESVAWAAERKDVLSTVFWLLATATYIAWVRRRGALLYSTTLLLLLLGLAAKPTLVTLPFTFLLLDYWPLERLRFDRSALRLVGEKLPLFAVVFAFAILTFAAQSEGGAVAVGADIPLSLRAANAVMSYGLYVWKTVWPADLALLYPHPNLAGGTPWRAWQVASMSAGLLAASALFLRARRRPYLAVGWLWFLGTLVPMIGIVQAGSQAMADRYTYVSCIGLYVMATWSGADCVQRASGRRRGAGTAVVLAALVALAILGSVSRRQVAYWRDTITLFEHSLAVAPGATFLHNNLANELRERGDAFEAMKHSLLAKNVDLASADAEILLARACLDEKDLECARLHLERALEIDPANVNAHIALGGIQRQVGNPEEAIRLLRSAVALDPASGAAHLALAVELLSRGERSDALAEFREAVRVEPDELLNLTLLGHGLRATGNLDEAIVFYRRGVEVAPGSAEAYVNLGNALMARGDVDEALVFYRQAVVIAPDAAETREPLERAVRERRSRAESDQSSESDPDAGPR